MYRIAGIAIVLILLLITPASGQSPTGSSVGSPASDFLLMDQQGKNWRLSELRGKVVFLYFWASWCPPCREEIISLQRLHEMLPGEGFTMLAISSDKPHLTNKLVEKLGLTMPILHDAYTDVGKKYQLTTLPHTMILDKQGVIREKFNNSALWDSPELMKKLEKLFNE